MVTFDIDWLQVLGLVIGVVLPLLVALVTKLQTRPALRAILLVALSVVLNLLTELLHALQDKVTYNLGTALTLALGTFVIGVATHYGLWKPTGAAVSLQAVGDSKSKDSDVIVTN